MFFSRFKILGVHGSQNGVILDAFIEVVHQGDKEGHSANTLIKRALHGNEPYRANLGCRHHSRKRLQYKGRYV